MRWNELIDHRHAVLVQAWNSGNMTWFRERAKKYALANPYSIWRGVHYEFTERGETPWPYCLVSK